MQHITAKTAKRNFSDIVNTAAKFNEPFVIVSDDNKAVVLLSMEEYNNIQETLYLQSIPGMVDSIKAAAAEPLEDGVDASEVNFDV